MVGLYHNEFEFFEFVIVVIFLCLERPLFSHVLHPIKGFYSLSPKNSVPEKQFLRVSFVFVGVCK